MRDFHSKRYTIVNRQSNLTKTRALISVRSVANLGSVSNLLSSIISPQNFGRLYTTTCCLNKKSTLSLPYEITIEKPLYLQLGKALCLLTLSLRFSDISLELASRHSLRV
jgi:hypothetical protein